jgi:hypothetical protein
MAEKIHGHHDEVEPLLIMNLDVRLQVQRYRTTFLTSIIPVAGQIDTFRLFWGAADASVATGTLKVTYTRA